MTRLCLGLKGGICRIHGFVIVFPTANSCCALCSILVYHLAAAVAWHVLNRPPDVFGIGTAKSQLNC